jgi:hypothetical protein
MIAQALQQALTPIRVGECSREDWKRIRSEEDCQAEAQVPSSRAMVDAFHTVWMCRREGTAG